MAAKDELGKRGELLAREHLHSEGYELLDTNWRCAHGEIDIVARDRAETVVVEVKTRSSLAFGHPFEAITAQKRARLRRLALSWREETGSGARLRVDAIAVLLPRDGEHVIEHRKGVC